MQYDIPLSKPCFTGAEIKEIECVINSGWVSQGAQCKTLENLLLMHVYNDCPDARVSLVSSCTAAIYIVLKWLDVKPGDEVIVADFSYPATGLAVVNAGATPRFCDVNLHVYNIEIDKIRNLINNKTKAIIPVHTFGNPCPMDDVNKIARENDLFVIWDAACAIGTTYHGKSIANLDGATCLSFHARKGVTTGEGGAIVSKNHDLIEFAQKFATFGVGGTYQRDIIPSFETNGFNFKMSDVSATLGLEQVRNISEIVRTKRQLASIYTDLLSDTSATKKYVLLPQLEICGRHSYQSYVATVHGGERDNLVSVLRKNKIKSTIGTYSQCIQPVFNSSDTCPVSTQLFRKTISLPMYCHLTEDDIHRVVDVIRKCH